jgi:hypothetical protein
MLTSVGECPYDEGGYFVADGRKIVVSNELVITNRAIVRHTGRFEVLGLV